MDNTYETQDYEVTLTDGTVYQIRLIRYLQVQGKPYQVIQLTQQNNNFKGKLIFSEQPKPSTQQFNLIDSLKLPIGKISADSFKIQSDYSNSNIVRATFLTLIKDYPERFEIVYDKSNKKIFSYRFIDQGFAQLD